MTHSATSDAVADGLERIVVASVAITARALAEVAPELTFLQWRVIVLVDTPNGVGVGPIATALGAKIAAVSRLIGRLRARGLVRTERSADDARVVLVSLTPAGTELRGRVVERRRAELRAMLEQTQLPSDAKAIVDDLAGVLEASA